MGREISTNHLLNKLVIYLTLLAFLSAFGCNDGGGSGGGDAGTQEYSFIQGCAYFDGPIANAQLGIYDENGVRLLEEPVETGEDGEFAVFVLGMPEAFYIEVSGGRVIKSDEDGNLYDEFFNETVGRYVDEFQSGQYIDVNILSSLLLDVWEAEPHKDYSDIKQSMHDYLQFPDYYTMDEVLEMADWNTALFDPQYFFEGMAENGYADYSSFLEYASQLINDYYLDPGSVEELEYPWRNMPKGLRDSALSGVYAAFGDGVDNQSPLYRSEAGGGKGAAIGQGIDIGLNIIGFILNAIYKNTAETEEGRALGKFLAIIFEGGTDPVVEAIMANLTAINEGISKIDLDLNNLWAAMHQEFKNLQAITLSQKTRDATSKIRDWNDELHKWKKEYKKYKSMPSNAVVDKWIKELDSTDFGVKRRVQDIYDELVPATGKNLIQAWFEEMQAAGNPHTDPVKRAAWNKKLYNIMRSNLVRLIVFQTMGLNLYTEMVHKQNLNDKAKAKDLTLDFTNTVLDWIQKEVKEFEQVMEAYALDQEWYIYSDNAKLDYRQRCPDFPGGLAHTGILADVDKIMQMYVFAKLTHENGKIKSLKQQGLVTIRIVAPAQTEVADNFGIAGLKEQSASFWDIYNDFAQTRSMEIGWKPVGLPSASTAGPGAADADKEFSVSDVAMYGEFIPGNHLWAVSASEFEKEDGYPKTLSGRSPFETRKTQQGGRESWNYRMFKFRKKAFAPDSVNFEANRKYYIEMKAALGEASAWHPNLKQVLPKNQSGPADQYIWNKEKTGAPCITFGAYGVKSSQKVRLMAYHGQRADHSEWHDWWFRGWKNNNYDAERLFATRFSAYTFFDMQPLGNGWYAFRDAGSRAYDQPDLGQTMALAPITYFGEWSNKHTHNDGRNFVRVADNGEIKFDLAYIDYRCAFQLAKRNEELGKNHVGAKKTEVHQPAAKMYTFKTNHPNIDAPGSNKYLKWKSIFAQWARYYADGGTSDVNHRDTWVIVYPEYDDVADYFLNRPNDWDPRK